jgi:hypothetical protein
MTAREHLIAGLASVRPTVGAPGERRSARSVRSVGMGLLASALCAGALISASPALAENPVEIGTTSGTCTGPQSVGYTVPTSEQPDQVLYRLTATGGAGTWVPDFYAKGFGSGDTLWDHHSASYPLDGSVYCDAGQSPGFTVKAYRVPSAPSTFSGRGTPSGGNSDLRVTAPYSASYLGDVGVTSGAITIAGSTVASPRTISFGSRSKNDSITPFVDPLDGPPAVWTVTIRPQPVALSDVDLSPGVLVGGDSARFSYTVDAEADVTAVIKNAAGQVVRSLATGLHVQPGPHSLTFDGLTQSGAPLPDGFYATQINLIDPSGNPASAIRTIALDTTGPQVTVLSSNPLAARNGFVAGVSDQISGIAGSTLSVDGSQVDQGTGRLSYRPGDGWTPGTRRTWKVDARDGSGNTTSRSGTFRVPEQPLSLAGAKRDIKAALKAANYRTWVRRELRVRCKRLSRSSLRCKFTAKNGGTGVSGKGTVARKRGERSYNLKVVSRSPGYRPSSERLSRPIES